VIKKLLFDPMAWQRK